jgi:hypothetical protein
MANKIMFQFVQERFTLHPMRNFPGSILKWAAIMPLLAAMAAAQDVNPYPRPVVKIDRLLEWSFQSGTQGWTAAHDCSIDNAGGSLRVRSTGIDPYLFGPAIEVDGPFIARLRMKCSSGGDGQIFWSTTAEEDFAESRSRRWPLIHDGQWHDYTVPLPAKGRVRRLRLDPGEAPGTVEVASFQLVRETLQPLEILSVQTKGAEVSAVLTNHSAATISFAMDGGEKSVAGHATVEVHQTAPGREPFGAYEMTVNPAGLPPVRRTVRIVDLEAPAKWVKLQSGDIALRATENGSGACIERGGQTVAVLSPLVRIEGATPRLKLAKRRPALEWSGEGIIVQLSLHGDEIQATVKSGRVCEGPVLRAFGPLEQGLFAGLEYLAAGERSSSTLDIETDEHIRYAPDPMKVTMPLMAFVTERATTAMTWGDMSLRPVYATPNFLDGPQGDYASLRGRGMDCTILVRKPAPLEEAILWAVKRRGLPPLPEAPRPPQAERDLCLKALSGPPLKTGDGWRHCAGWAPQPYADQASTVWRLSGQIPALPRLTPTGSHIRNDAIYFVTGRAREWLDALDANARGTIAAQKPDGSFRYEGEYRRGHFEDTASGYCASHAVALLEDARFTGNGAALEAGLKALEYMKHFRDPRGAQTWECPLHTPDILASAFLVDAYLRGYELTGKDEYRERARDWAITGLPFVYQWSNRPIMAYATIAVYGASNWRAPNWMGLPVQWCGYDYAYALNRLAPLDQTLDWKRIATGILLTAEQMQFPDGELAGCEPDSFNLAAQNRNGPAINPCAIVSLALALEGRLDSLAVAVGGGRRVVAPFPVSITGGLAHVQGQEGVAYQIVVDGARIVSVNSRGADVIPLKNL